MPTTAAILQSVDARGVTLIGFEDRLVRRSVKILEDLQGELLERIRAIEAGNPVRLTARRARLGQLLKQTQGSIDRAYRKIAQDVQMSLEGVAAQEIQYSNRLLGQQLRPLKSFGVSANTVAVSPGILRELARNTAVSMGEAAGAAPIRDWVAAQSAAFQAKFAQQMNRSIQLGEGSATAARRLMGARDLFGVSRRQAATLVRTSTQSVVSESRRRIYSQNTGTLEGIYQLSNIDDRTTEICVVYDHRKWRFGEGGELIPVDHALPYQGGIPRHPNCRSVDMPWVKSLKDMGIKPGEVDSRLRRIFDGKVPPNDFMKTASIARQNKLLGVRKAQLVRAGKLKLEDLVTRDGLVRTTKNAEALVARRAATAPLKPTTRPSAP